MIPSERIAPFYELLGRFLRDGDPEIVTPSPVNSVAQPQGKRTYKNWNEEQVHQWTAQGTHEERVRTARQFLHQLAPGARRFLEYLLDHEHSEAPADEIVRALKLESARTLAGQTSSFGFVAKRLKRLQPFHMRAGPSGESIYVIDPGIAKIFREAREQEARR